MILWKRIQLCTNVIQNLVTARSRQELRREDQLLGTKLKNGKFDKVISWEHATVRGRDLAKR